MFSAFRQGADKALAAEGMHMATLIGTVSKVIGQVFAVAGDGTRRVLVEGIGYLPAINW